jgi:alpha-mannosidase
VLLVALSSAIRFRENEQRERVAITIQPSLPKMAMVPSSAVASLIFLWLRNLLLLFLLVDSCSAQPPQQQDAGSVINTITPEYEQLLPPVTKFTADLHNPRVLNVHVVPHTHNNVGWLKTVEQYYYGLNNTIQNNGNGGVQSSLDSLVQALGENENRTFVIAEQRYFSMWWLGLNGDNGNGGETAALVTKNRVKTFLEKQQLSFAHGGWSAHDEACTHFMGMIDQITTGHEFLKQALNYTPTVAWQLNSYGHSSTQASLLTFKMGMNAVYFGRVDYQDLEQRKLTRQTEGLWAGSSVHHLKDATTIFWGLTGSYSGGYGPPNGFGHHDSSVNNLLQTMSAQQRISHITNLLLPQLATQALQTQGNHMMLTMGADFDYQTAPIGFASMDLMIQETNRLVNQDISKDTTSQQQLVSLYIDEDLGYDSLNLFYSSPEYYTQVKFQQSRHGAPGNADASIVKPPPKASASSSNASDNNVLVDYTVKTDDFFPYADNKESYWTGYFVSRTSLKRLERVASSILMSARQVEALSMPVNGAAATTNADCDCGKSTFALEDALGVMQHHDAITGTAKQHVAFDYAKRVQAGINKAMPLMVDKLKHLFLKDAAASGSSSTSTSFLQDLTFCQLLNETICPVSEQMTTTQQGGLQDENTKNDLYVIVYNPLAQEQSTVIQLPVGSNQSAYVITKVGGEEQEDEESSSSSSSTPIKVKAVAVQANEKLPGKDTADYYINFYTGMLPPVGAALYKITTTENDAENGSTEQSDGGSLSTVRNGDGRVSASNGIITVHFDESSGELMEIESKVGTLVSVQQTWGFYTSAPYSSGAYVFRPMDEPNHPFKSINSSIVETRDAIESHVHYEGGWIHQVTRLGKNSEYLEIEYTIGPIPIDDHKGKEIVTRYNASTSISNDKVCYTDANGREFQRRVYNHRETWDLDVTQSVAGNYYPVTTAIYIEDDNAALSVVTDRTVGGACLENGVIELIVQRRILYDDGRGVGECLNETTDGVTPYPPFGEAKRQGTGIVIRGKHRLSIGKGNHGASLSRAVMDKAFAEPLVFVASAPSGETPIFRSSQGSALKQALPKNVMLITYLRRRSDLFLVRLSHQYAPGEDSTLSKAAEVDLSLLFRDYSIKSIRETTLSGNQDYQTWVDRRMDWTGTGTLSPPFNVDDASDAATTVTIQPMDVRAFHVEVVLLGTNNEAPPSPPLVPVPDSTSAGAPTSSPAAVSIVPVPASTSTGPPTTSSLVNETEKPTMARPAGNQTSPHHSPTHKSSPVSSSGKHQEDSSSPSSMPVYFTIAVVAAIAAFLLYRRHKAKRGRYNHVVAGEQTFDMDMELQVSSYQPGLL